MSRFRDWKVAVAIGMLGIVILLGVIGYIGWN